MNICIRYVCPARRARLAATPCTLAEGLCGVVAVAVATSHDKTFRFRGGGVYASSALISPVTMYTTGTPMNSSGNAALARAVRM
jgi:hypothetical protein